MKVLIVFYSQYGHTRKLAESVAEGARAVAGAEVVLRRVAEFPDVEKATANSEHAKKEREAQKNIPVATLDDLRAADAVIWGSPTRYGNMTAQMKQFIDSTAQLWLKGELEGKPAAVFTSTSTTHGGQESTLLSMMIPLFHLGMIVLGVPYSTPGMLHVEGRGATPYGASVLAGGRNELEPKAEDLAIGAALGRRVAEVTKKLRG
jgi:NAD(P)H dehydrogenase (quinone)